MAHPVIHCYILYSPSGTLSDHPLAEYARHELEDFLKGSDATTLRHLPIGSVEVSLPIEAS